MTLQSVAHQRQQNFAAALELAFIFASLMQKKKKLDWCVC